MGKQIPINGKAQKPAKLTYQQALEYECYSGWIPAWLKLLPKKWREAMHKYYADKFKNRAQRRYSKYIVEKNHQEMRAIQGAMQAAGKKPAPKP